MDIQLDPARDDLPLMANTSHILVKHYVLDLDVDFESQVIEGTIVLFLEDGNRFKKQNSSIEEACQSESNKACKFGMPEPCHIPVTNARTFSSEMEYNDFAICSKGEKDTSDKDGNHDNQEHASGISSSKYCCDTGNHGSEDFLLVLDCCDLSVLKVEEVDVAAVPGLEKFTRSPELTVVSEEFRNQIVRELVTLPANRWREQLDYYARCSQAPGCGELLFDTDTWSLQIRKTGAQTATDFPHAIRIWYKTKPEGRSVTWTSDQSGRPCVYTVGSPINNRALFPCQEPPVAMSTWQATVRAAASFVVLMSGENSAKPTQLWEECSSWYYYVTMPMPASTFTIAVGCWTEMKMETWSSNDLATERPFSPSEANFRHVGVCSHMEYPCRFQNASATTQEIIPHRVFAPVCLTGACQETLLRLIPPCLSAAHSVLGAHPFSRLDVLIVPANFPSLGMARPSKDKTGHTSDSGASVIKHGLNPEKIFMQVHYLKGYFLLRFLAKRLGDETYFSFLRKFVHTFHGQLILSQDFLQMLLENIPEEKRLELSVENIYQDWLESSGIPKPLQRERRAGAECGLARQVRAEVTKWIGVNRRPRKRKRREKEEVFEKLLPDQLVLLLEHLLEQKTLSPRTLQSLQRTYHLQDQDAEVRHRWCELIVKHKFTKAYKSVERFLQEDQERPQQDSFIRLLLAWGTRLELTLDIKGGIMWLLKPSAHSPVHILVLLFPRGWSQPGTHKRQILVNAASLPGGCLLPWIWSGAALRF
ncbi:aminopeptidase O isoform 9 [Homo sapiens]|uniref:aminopeptidase O isoform 9 n=2 Tax=Homo sapiens TaxID=9606 RepID=UPI000387CEE6|nr:aminopeptidase O isoform 9 [Homo sapiens]XP_047279935.1 aminopeptidase O isoform X3 [Homo sapiens]|eukprot:XP_005252341.1 aminopeptidase O isoform X5 [Homo sapiens]